MMALSHIMLLKCYKDKISLSRRKATGGKGNELCIDLGILNQEELTRAGEMIANGLSEGDIIILSGEIGSGKTTFTRGLSKALGATQLLSQVQRLHS